MSILLMFTHLQCCNVQNGGELLVGEGHKWAEKKKKVTNITVGTFKNKEKKIKRLTLTKLKPTKMNYAAV